MPRLKLSARGVAAAKTDRTREEFWDTVTPGLVLRVSGKSGAKTWGVRYRAAGARRRQKLGGYPQLSLSEARAAAREVQRRADAGDDPAKERADRKAGRYTFWRLADEVLAARAMRTRVVTQRERARMLQKDLLPAWGDRPVADITRREVVHLVEGIARRGAPVVANRTLGLIRLIFNDGLRRGFPTLEANPAHLVEPPTKETGRDRYLTSAEIGIVWQATEDETRATRGAFRLALLTGQRIGSVCAMRWDGIRGDLWTIPPEHFKGKRTHLVPLSAEALGVIEQLRADAQSDTWVFPSRARTEHEHLTNLAGSLSRVRKKTSIPNWTVHDFRATFRTHAVRATEDGGLAIPAHVADAVLGHKEATLGFARYTGDRDRYLLHEKRSGLQKWGAFVRNAVEGGGMNGDSPFRQAAPTETHPPTECLPGVT
ncbi:MAG: tyrosine-type recombinase/integrase [Gemmatimonadota bacterium]|nr:tyrosine-type recombinase/integrase [Gemmatimonadota bacterium]